MDKHERLSNALRGLPVDRPPVWFMRQAGRYMEEYRAVRAKVSFLDLCHTPEIAAEVTCQPVDRFDTDCAIVFSDILPVLSAIGRDFTMEKGIGPRVPEPVRTLADVDSLVRPDVSEALPWVPETIRIFKEARPDVPILGFAGAPWTLFCYLVEGKGSKDWLEPKKMLMTEPAAAERVLNLIADVVGDYLQSQIDAGAAGVQMFDTWAGALSREDYERFALPASIRAFERVKGAPRIFYSKDLSSILPIVKKVGADVIGLDWRTDMAEARALLGDIPVQGNLDPIALYGPPDDIEGKVRRIIQAAGPTGHVFNLGHGVLPTTPIEGVEAMLRAVKAWRW
ncbi:MAG: uroporphyrinogen decarboxylase [Myxococcales bacterium]|nr:uroporphyrinogen decarboxylase [Myxococcales bacterium]MCB9670320.1 uroporphyrinogen decarboxylase [Alphaproteobacteria bacterium]MCB9693424.1 uroporphyrinogen decarboxylase [Alphaproteobacteria bacterium]